MNAKSAFLIVGVIGCSAVILLLGGGDQPSDPVFEGKPLSSWLGELSLDNSLQTRSNAHLAVCEIGTNGFPLLLNYLGKADRSPTIVFVTKIWSKLARRPIPEDPIFRRLQAVQGFKALGPIGRPAIPELKRLMLNRALAYDAARALGALREPAILPTFMGYMSDPDPNKRAAALAGCESMGESARSAVPTIIRLLDKDQEAWVRASAASALGSVGPPDMVISPLVRSLENDSNLTVRVSAAYSLGAFPKNFSDFEEKLRQASRDTSIQVRSVASQTLQRLLQVKSQ